MAPWWLRTHKDEHLNDSSIIDDPASDLKIGDPAAGSPPDVEVESEAKSSIPAAEETSSETPSTETPSIETAASASGVKPKRKRRRRRRKPNAAAQSAPEQATSKPETYADDSQASASKPIQVTGRDTAADDVTADNAVADDAAAGGPSKPLVVSTPAKAETSVPPPSQPATMLSTLPRTVTTTQAKSPPLEGNYVFSFPERKTTEERKLALFCDFENIALGVRASEVKKLDINLILARLLEKGKIIVKKAYADWERYNEYKRPLHEAAIELIDIPQKYYSGKNSADIKLVVDAMDLCYSKEHLDTFVILSGDSDFSPLVSKLKENNKVVIGIGIKDSSSGLLVENCDEFVFYEDIWRAAQKRPTLDDLPPQKAEVFGLMADAMLALLRENKEVLWGSLVKQTMQRKSPSFNEEFYGYGSFSEMLEDAERHKVIGLRRDQRSGNYVVTGFVNA